MVPLIKLLHPKCCVTHCEKGITAKFKSLSLDLGLLYGTFMYGIDDTFNLTFATEETLKFEIRTFVHLLGEASRNKSFPPVHDLVFGVLTFRLRK